MHDADLAPLSRRPASRLLGRVHTLVLHSLNGTHHPQAVELHFAYNTLVLVPTVIAVILYWRGRARW